MGTGPGGVTSMSEDPELKKNQLKKREPAAEHCRREQYKSLRNLEMRARVLLTRPLSAHSSAAARSFASRKADIWVSASAKVVRQGTPLLLVEKVQSVSDGIFDSMNAMQWGPSALRLILFDAQVLNLEAPFAGNQNSHTVSGGDVRGGIGIEDLIDSPTIRDLYHKHKPFVAQADAQDITDPTFRPFITVLGVEQDGRVRVRPSNDVDDARATSRSKDVLLSGLPITRRVSLQSPEGAVKDALKWMWVRGNIDRSDIEVGAGSASSSLEGADLLYGDCSRQHTRRFRFTQSSFVPGDLELVVAGCPVKVYVNTKDVVERKPAGSIQAHHVKVGLIFFGVPLTVAFVNMFR